MHVVLEVVREPQEQAGHSALFFFAVAPSSSDEI